MKLRVVPFRIHPRHAFTIARSSHTWYDNVRVEVEEEGITGFGEAAPSAFYGETQGTVLAALEALRPAIEEGHPDEVRALEGALERRLGGNGAARSAVSAACHDWRGKRYGAPLHRLLGAGIATIPPTSFTIAIAAPAEMAARVAEAGEFRRLKVKMGFEGDEEAIRRIAQVSDVPLRVDANAGWTRSSALRKLDLLEELGVELVEQPLPAADLEGLAALRDASSIPVIADESCVTARDLARLAGVVDGVNVKLAKAGSIGEALRIIEGARALGMLVMLGCMIESTLGISAAAHLSPLVDYVDLDGHLLIGDDPFTGLRLVDGCVLPSGEPGLGVRPADSREDGGGGEDIHVEEAGKERGRP
ncbi:MAG: dipeptide epimerase [Gemmatimonadetes bacterium]|nr:dipeptide epimerase [Gemmatimonadota bacterium]